MLLVGRGLRKKTLKIFHSSEFVPELLLKLDLLELYDRFIERKYKIY
jgi:hypothetical protein